MNISLIIGWVLSFGLVVFGIFDGGQIMWFVEVASLAITVGGTIGCLVASFPMSYLAGVPKKFGMALFPKKYKPEKYIDDIVEYAKIARGRGLLALEESANGCQDQFMKSALMLIVDANDAEKVRGMLDDAISFMVERHENGRAFFEKGVGIFPAFGMLGTLVGLVNMLNTMDTNPDGLASGMATALITTFYGSLFANVLFAPLAAALKNTHEDELLCMQIIEEGVLAIAAGSNPRYIQEKLEFMLPKSKKKSDSAGA
ncbi:MAG: motility protein A [Ruminococcaceae bacterium]|nr:motility protein A [Oscillospiraceae bacterium]